MNTPPRYHTRLLTTAALLAGLTASLPLAASGQVVIRDDFNGSGNIDWETWRIPFGGDSTFLGRTQLGTDPNVDVPQQVGGNAVISLNTFSVIDPGGAFFGQEFQSRASFARGGGLAVEYRAKFDGSTLPAGVGGVVGGLFSYDVTREISGNLVRDEIDTAELLTNEVANGQGRIFTNIWDDGDFNNSGAGAFVAPAVDLTQYNTYRTEWTDNAVKWFINGNLVRTETTVVPNDPMSVRANIWAPDAGFSEAFDAALQPTASAGSNQQIQLNIDYIEVERLNTTLSDNLLGNGGFDDPSGVTTNPAEADGKWFLFNNAFLSSETASADDDGFLLKTFGPFGFQTDASGAFQDIPALPGQEFEGSVEAITITGDTIVGKNNYGEIAIEFLDANKNALGNRRVASILDGRDPNAVEDTFLTGLVNGIAPEGTAYARLLLPFIQLIDGGEENQGFGDGGAFYYDAASLRLIEAAAILGLAGDFSGNGTVEQADLDLVLRNWGAATTPAGFVANTSGLTDGVDQDELDAVLGNWGSSTAPSFAGSAVPEPATAAVLAGLGTALLARRRRTA